MKNHDKLCHGDFVPSNIIVKENGEYVIIDWSHATQGNGSADVANTYLIFSMRNQKELAEKYVNLYCEKTGTDKKEIQRWIPIVAAIRKIKGKVEEQEMLDQWINIVDYE
jgi:thiamine kinase-like enzyme